MTANSMSAAYSMNWARRGFPASQDRMTVVFVFEWAAGEHGSQPLRADLLDDNDQMVLTIQGETEVAIRSARSAASPRPGSCCRSRMWFSRMRVDIASASGRQPRKRRFRSLLPLGRNRSDPAGTRRVVTRARHLSNRLSQHKFGGAVETVRRRSRRGIPSAYLPHCRTKTGSASLSCCPASRRNCPAAQLVWRSGLSPSLISHHLGVLEGAGLIERRKDGLWTLNSLRRDELGRRLEGLERLVRRPQSRPREADS